MARGHGQRTCGPVDDRDQVVSPPVAGDATTSLGLVAAYVNRSCDERLRFQLEHATAAYLRASESASTWKDWVDVAAQAGVAHDAAVELGAAADASEWMSRHALALLKSFDLTPKRSSSGAAELPTFEGPTEPLTWKEAARRLGFGSGDSLRERVRSAADDDVIALLRRYRVKRGRRSSCRADVVEFVNATLESARRKARENAARMQRERPAGDEAAVARASAGATKLLGRLR